MRKMRQSTINSGLDCAQKMSFQLDPKIPYHNGVVRAMGTAVHKGHEDYYLHRRETGELETDVKPWVRAALQSFEDEIERAEDRFDWRVEPAKPHLKTPKPEVRYDFEIAAEKIAEGIVYYHQNKCYWPEGYDIIEAELQFDLPWPDREEWIRHGTIDLVLRDTNNGQLVLVDHKTSKGPKKETDYSAAKTPQAAYYLHAAQLLDLEIGDLAPRFVYDVLALTHGKPVTFMRFDQHRTDKQIEAVQQQAEDLMTIIDRGGPFLPNTSSFLCSEMYCDFWDICPYGSTLKSQ